jgi:hypothetical protein
MTWKEYRRDAGGSEKPAGADWPLPEEIFRLGRKGND